MPARGAKLFPFKMPGDPEVSHDSASFSRPQIWLDDEPGDAVSTGGLPDFTPQATNNKARQQAHVCSSTRYDAPKFNHGATKSTSTRPSAEAIQVLQDSTDTEDIVEVPATEPPSGEADEFLSVRNVDDAASHTGNHAHPASETSIIFETPHPRLRASILPQSRNHRSVGMEPSQSPTQSNDDRSYEQYFNRSSPQPTNRTLDSELGRNPDEPTQSTSYGQRTLDEDDTGAVNFGVGNALARETQLTIPTDPGDVNFAHLQSDTQSRPLHYPSAPETPAPPHNPFAGKGRAQLLGGSQLFRQTQFSSPARGGHSPTSSRPSPHDFPQNSMSPNPIISSPLKAWGFISSPLGPITTSSPQIIPRTSSVTGNEITASYPDSSPKGVLVPETPHYPPPQQRAPAEPMDEYVSMRLSQQRRDVSETRPASDSSDDDDEILRRRRARSKQNAATRHLRSIRFQRPASSTEVEVPSTNKKLQQSRAVTEECLAHAHLFDGEETVADSQEGPQTAVSLNRTPVESTKAARSTYSGAQRVDPGTEEQGNFSAPLKTSLTGEPLDPGGVVSSNDSHFIEAIPETSPVEPRPPPIGEILDRSSGESSRPLSFPKIDTDFTQDASSRVTLLVPDDPTPGPSCGPTQTEVQDQQLSSSAPALTASHASDNRYNEPTSEASTRRNKETAEESKYLRSSPPNIGAKGQQSKKSVTQAETPSASSSSAPALSSRSTSILSSLGVTPVLSHGIDITPLTQETGDQGPTNLVSEVHHHSSPAVAKARRRDAMEALPRLKVGSNRNRKPTGRNTRRQSHHHPDSTDELARSPSSIPGLDQAEKVPKLLAANGPAVRTSRLSTGRSISREPSHEIRLFERMIFAISFQSKKTSESTETYSHRMEQADSLQKRIEAAGGRVLVNGFDELFESLPIKSAASSPSIASTPDCEINLLPEARATRFAALIADGHSRKVKYMQALALGLPCIAMRWVVTCIEKNKIVDWSPYLLCAGASSFLGDAIRSRNIPPYDASTAKLVDIVEHRPRLLAGSRILLVMKKSAEAKRMAYVFLARALGASLSRVYNVEEGRVKLKAMEDLGRPYDWVYVDEKTDRGGDLFANAVLGGGRKRKRTAAASASGPPPKRVRTLSDERVIQSLILGRLIEEEELEV